MTVTLCTEELRPLVEKLISTYPTNLDEIDPDRIVYLRGKGKHRPASIASVRNPWDLCTKFKFILTVHGPKYDKLDNNKKAIAIFDELIRIKDFEASSLKPYSVQGNYETFTKFGLDWLEAEQVESIFKE